MAEKFEYTREWTDAEAFPLLGFTKSWENPDDYPTIELDETQVRKDMQSLHDEVKNYINDKLIPAVLAEDATEAARAAAEETRVANENARIAAETAREEKETGYVAQAEQAAARADEAVKSLNDVCSACQETLENTGAEQVSRVSGEGDTQVSRVSGEGDTQVSRVSGEGETQTANAKAQADAAALYAESAQAAKAALEQSIVKNPGSTVIDPTLSIAGAAAEAAAVGQLKSELSDVEYRLNNGFTTWSNIENGSANGAGIYEDSDRLVTGLIPVKKGWVLRIKHGSLVHGDILWKESVSPANCYLSSSTRYTDYDIEIQHNGFACIVFRYDPVSAISPSDFDGAVEIIDTFYRNVLVDVENIRNDVEQKSKELSNDVHNELTGLKESVELSFELGTINTNTGAESTSTTRARSNMFYLSKPMRVASVDDSYTFRPIKYSADGKTCLGALVTYNLSEYQLEDGYSYRLLIFPNKLDSLDGHIEHINNSIIVMLKKSVYVISKDGTGDFDDIQRCLDFISKTEPTTVVVKAGTYDKVSTMTQKKYVDDTTGNNNIKWYNRKLNIIGLSEKDCIIRSDTGEYYTPSAEINITGEVRNITFISTHDNPPSNKSDDVNYLKHKAYALHSDAGTEDSLYRNCTFISYQAPAVGIGGANNKHIRFQNCHFYSFAPATGEYSVLKDYGGLFYHLMTSDGITGQNIEVENCYVFSENGNKAGWFTVSTATNYEQETHLRNNCFYGEACGKTVGVDSVMLSNDCFGNNIESLNK